MILHINQAPLRKASIFGLFIDITTTANQQQYENTTENCIIFDDVLTQYILR